MTQETMNALLIEAVDRYDIEHVKAYAAKGGDVNVNVTPKTAGQAVSMPLYHYMLSYRWTEEMSDFMLEQGVPVDVKNAAGNTPLMVAVKKGDMRNVDYFLKKGANPLEVNNNGEMVLQQAQHLSHDLEYRQKIIDALVAKLPDATQKGHVAAAFAAAAHPPAEANGQDLSTHQEIKPLKTVTFGGGAAPQKPKADFKL